MAVTIKRYNQTPKRFLNKEVTFTTIKAMLLNSTQAALFDATHTTVDQAAGAQVSTHRPNEVYGNGWAEGGMLVTGVTVSVRTVTGAALTIADTRVTATGGNIGPARAALYYDATTMAPLYMDDFGQDQTAGQETDFLLVFDPTGVRGTMFTVS